MNFKVGDTVVCIDAINARAPTGLIAGTSYVVCAMQTGCCHTLVGLVGEKRFGHSVCPFCGHNESGSWFAAWRFIKLDGLTEYQHTEEEQTA